MPNFDSIADKVMETVERPALAPIGDYIWQVTALPTKGEVTSDKGSWETLEFPMQVVAPTDAVDPDLVKAYGSVTSIRGRKTFMFTKDENDKAAFEQTEFALKSFLQDHLQIDGSLSLREAVNASVNKRCIGELRYRPDKNNKDVQYHDLGRTAPIV